MEKQEKRNKKDNSKRLLIIVNVLLLLLLLVAAGGVYSFKLSKDKEIARLNEIIKVTEENNIIIPIEDFKEYAQRYGRLAQFSQRYFPDYLVYVGYSGITFREIDTSLKENKLGNFEKISRDDKGRIYYQDGSYQSLAGIDVSDHQGYIDWKKVKNDGIDFAYIRVGYRGYSEGQLNVDGYFQRNIAEANKAKLAVGVYFFSGAITEKEAVAEADMVIRYIRDYQVDLPIAFDMEDINSKSNRMKNLTVEQRVLITKAFCERIKEKGYQPMIYGNAAWLMERLDYREIANYDIWYANWDYFHWPYQLVMYQYSSNGKVEGIEGRVDMNIGFFNYQD